MSFSVAIENCDYDELQRLMNANFDLRRQLYGDDVLGPENLRMINLGRQVSRQKLSHKTYKPGL